MRDLKWKAAWREWIAMHVQAECTTPKPMDSETNTERDFFWIHILVLGVIKAQRKKHSSLPLGTIPPAPARLILLSIEQKGGGFSFPLQLTNCSSCSIFLSRTSDSRAHGWLFGHLSWITFIWQKMQLHGFLSGRTWVPEWAGAGSLWSSHCSCSCWSPQKGHLEANFSLGNPSTLESHLVSIAKDTPLLS